MFDILNYIEDGTGKTLFCLVKDCVLELSGFNCLQLVADGGMGTKLSQQAPEKLEKSISFASYVKRHYPHIEI